MVGAGRNAEDTTTAESAKHESVETKKAVDIIMPTLGSGKVHLKW